MDGGVAVEESDIGRWCATHPPPPRLPSPSPCRWCATHSPPPLLLQGEGPSKW